MKIRVLKTIAAAALIGISLPAQTVSAQSAYPAAYVGYLFNQQIQQSAGRIIISEPGQYTLTGDMSGMIFVDPGAGDVKLTLDGARINGADGPAIVAMSGDSLSIELATGSRNTVFGGSNSSYDAAIYSRIPLTFDGGGYINMQGTGQNGTRVEDAPLYINGGNFNVYADQNGFSASDIVFNDGRVSYSSDMNGFAPETNVRINGGTMSEFTASQSVMNQFQNDFMQSFQSVQTMQSMQPIQSTQPNQSIQSAPSMQSAQATQPAQFMQPTQSTQPVQPTQSTQSVQSTVTSATEIVTGITSNSAMDLTADYDNATTIVITNDDSTVKIDETGTYIVTGSSDDGSITVTKGTTGVVLVLDDLDLTSTSGATLSVNKNAEVQIVISGTVTLTDNENPDDENSTDADVADAYDGAAIKVKAGSTVYITGDGTLNVNGNAKNGIKAGDESSLIIGGDLTMNVNAANDGINGNYDVTILGGTVNVSAGDDGIHADHILTIGSEGSGPDLTIKESVEGLEGTVVNIAGGKIDITASDDGINGANGDGIYEGELDYSVNITGGSTNITAGADGVDSNGNVNLVGGSMTIQSANNGGDAGIDYDGEYYISNDFNLNSQSGVAGPDNMMGGQPDDIGGQPGDMGGQPGDMGGQPGDMGGQPGDMGGQPGDMGGQPGDMGGQPGDMGGQPGDMGGQPGDMGGQPDDMGGQPMGR